MTTAVLPRIETFEDPPVRFTAFKAYAQSSAFARLDRKGRIIESFTNLIATDQITVDIPVHHTAAHLVVMRADEYLKRPGSAKLLVADALGTYGHEFAVVRVTGMKGLMDRFLPTAAKVLGDYYYSQQRIGDHFFVESTLLSEIRRVR